MSGDGRLTQLAESVVFGAVSGSLSSALLQPFDRLKTVMQDPSAAIHAKFRDSYRLVVRRYGLSGLWRGLVPSLFRVVPGVALYFGTLDFMNIFVLRGAKPTSGQNFCLGMFARTFAGTLLMPATVLKTRFESNYYHDRNLINGAKSVYNQYGIKGFFAGVGATILRDAPFSGLYLMFYRKQLSLLSSGLKLYALESQFGFVLRFGSGVSAGLVACAITQPFDVVKTHIQLFPTKYKTLFSTCCLLYRESGLSIFVVGFLPRAMRRTIMAALNWTLFDELEKRISRKKEE